jgi:hypothetical protein
VTATTQQKDWSEKEQTGANQTTRPTASKPAKSKALPLPRAREACDKGTKHRVELFTESTSRSSAMTNLPNFVVAAECFLVIVLHPRSSSEVLFFFHVKLESGAVLGTVQV